jgi:hypothetical protein
LSCVSAFPAVLHAIARAASLAELSRIKIYTKLRGTR